MAPWGVGTMWPNLKPSGITPPLRRHSALVDVFVLQSCIAILTSDLIVVEHTPEEYGEVLL